ncbi:cell wall hydrolase, partial [Staphylococcus aureus]|uniref:cell wall hydrolase n=1 Tax=Staphylococcus aureus TaxID=1280 RepID=UPI0039BEC441
MEAADQSVYGQYLVASVIVNRAKAGHKSLEAVCLARKQFSCWNSPKWAFSWLSRHYTPSAK